jgi:hypothetical protein
VRLVATRRTRSDGRYAIELPSGPSRSVFIHHVSGARVIARHGLALTSRVRPRLTVRPRRAVRVGNWLRFQGRLPGPACRGRVVEIQARIAKHRWQVFRTDRANRRCRYAARYRLRATTRHRRYRFRARVPRQGGYPYRPGHSKARTKKVRP